MGLVTFDLFSALIDSRSGASSALTRLAADHRWDVEGGVLYDVWDAHNKASQRDEPTWVPFAEHCRRAMDAALTELGLEGDPAGVTTALLGTLGDWPLWPDVAEHLPRIAAGRRIGVLSNVDDDLFARTKVAPLVADDGVLTSQRLRAYKPRPEIYRRARERAGGALVHVATSARDVRGALEAGIDVVHLRRAGHVLDPSGPVPAAVADDLADVARLLG